MADIRCVSNHAEDVAFRNGGVRSVPVGEIARDVNMDDPNNKRLINEAKLLVLVDEKKTRRGDDDK